LGNGNEEYFIWMRVTFAGAIGVSTSRYICTPGRGRKRVHASGYARLKAYRRRK
jgi:hypothetical protein